MNILLFLILIVSYVAWVHGLLTYDYHEITREEVEEDEEIHDTER